MHAPGRVIFHFQIKNHIVLARKLQNFFKSWNTLAHVLAVVPHTGIQPPQFRQGEVAYLSAAIAGAFERSIVDGDEARIACQMQVSLDKTCSQLDGTLKRYKRVLRCVAGSAPMCYDPWFSHELRAILADNGTLAICPGGRGCGSCNCPGLLRGPRKSWTDENPRHMQFVSQVGQCVPQRGNTINALTRIFDFHLLLPPHDAVSHLSAVR